MWLHKHSEVIITFISLLYCAPIYLILLTNKMITAIALKSISIFNFNLIQHVKTVYKPLREYSTYLLLLTKVDGDCLNISN